MKNVTNLLLLIALLFVIACGGTDDSPTPGDDGDDLGTGANSKPNILLIIADDMGLDATPGYSEGSTKANMPNLSSLMQNGLKFNNVWSAPTCSPTRATIITGKYGIETQVLEPGDDLSFSEISLQQYLVNNGASDYQTALIGKWHLSDGASDPLSFGIDHWAGSLGGGLGSYTNWNFTENGSTTTETEYNTTKYTDLAIDWIDSQDSPWFLWLSFNAPHSPFHLPPSDLHSQGNLSSDEASIEANPQPYYMAAIEAMDTEMGRLFESMSQEELANTTIIFIGDNGTPAQVSQSPYGQGVAKGSLYQGGINVPLVISGKGVNRFGDEDALINTTDLFVTIANIAGTSNMSVNNSHSFVDLLSDASASVSRTFAYADGAGNNSGFAVRNAEYKLINYTDGTEEMYNLISDPYESSNLLNGTLTSDEVLAKSELEAEAVKLGNTIDTGNESSCTNDDSIDTSNGTCDISSSFSRDFSESIANDIREITTNGVPTHNYSFNANVASGLNDELRTYEIDATPSQAPNTTSLVRNNGRPQFRFGVAMNGVLIAPTPAEPFIFENPETSEYNWDWVFEPSNNRQVIRLDCASAHVQSDGTYHYHVRMIEYANEILAGLGDGTVVPNEPVQIGWANDGYPIIYKYGYDASGSNLVELKASYKLRDGDRGGDGITAPCGSFNGKYTNDYEYDSSVGDLDECNGINRSITLNGQTFDYYYMITNDFPVISRCVVGSPSESFRSSN